MRYGSSMNNQLPLFMQWPYSVPFGAFAWLAASALIARMAGWASLAQRFRTQDDYEGQRFSFNSASMGHRIWPVNYGNCLFVTIGSRGIRLSVLFPFRFQHPPLFLPWSAVESVTEKRYFKIFRHAVIVVKDRWPQIRLRGSAADAVIKAHATYIKS